MTFARLLFTLLGIAGLLITAFIAITDRSWVAVFFFGPLLSIPLLLAVIGVPKRWFDSSLLTTTRDARGRLVYREYTGLDYSLLSLMTLSAVPLFWIRHSLPKSLDAVSDPGTVPIGVFLSVTYAAYAWQRRDFSGKISARAWTLPIALGVFMVMTGAPGFGDALLGFMLTYCGVWSLLRVGLMSLSNEPNTAAATTSVAAAPSKPDAARKGTFATLPVTMTLLSILAVVFVLEVFSTHSGFKGMTPTIDTLVADGALSHPSVLQSQQWYRLLSSALLHASPIHLLFNAYALFLAGAILENFVGRAWYFTIFTFGALGGSLMSLWINSPRIVSVGASGAIMALFAACYVTSFRREEGGDRKKLRNGLLQILVFSLIPLLGLGGGGIDIAAHLGGILSGGLVGALVLMTWDKTKGRPRLNGLAMSLSAIGSVGFIYAAVSVIQNYPH